MKRHLPSIALFLLLLQQCWSQPVNQGMSHTNGMRMNVTEVTSTRLPVFTVECWVRDSSRVVLAARDLPAAAGTDWSLVYNWANQCLEFMTQQNAGPDTYIFSPNGTLTPYQWQHIAVVVNGPAGTIRGYVNGVLVMNSAFSPRPFDANVALSWASYFNGGSNGIGRMDECRYWNLERTQQQIIDAMNSALALNDRQGLVGYWRFCGNYADSSGNHNNGIPNGTRIVDIPELPGPACCSLGSVPVAITLVGGMLPCQGDSATLDAGAGYRSYRWSNGDTTRTIHVGNGLYSVTVTDSILCPATATFLVRSNPRPVPQIAGPDTLCRSGSVCLSSILPYRSYRWSTGDTGRVLCVTQPGHYILTVTDSNGCTGSAQRDVFAHTATLQIGGKLSLCAGDTTALTASDRYRWYRWSTGDTTLGIRATKPGTYSVAAGSSDGCVDTAIVTVTGGAAAPSITASRLHLCGGDSAVLTASAGYRSYQWSSGETTRSITVRMPGTYIVTVVDSAGCTGIAQVTITFGGANPPVVSGPRSICDSAAIELEAEAGYRSYRWSTGDTTRRIAIHSPGTYTVTVVDSSGCSSSTQVKIGGGSARVPAITGPRLVCDSVPVTLDAGGGYVRYRWSTGDTTRMVTVRGAGTYTITVTDSNGCTAATSCAVTEGSSPRPVITGRNTLCFGDSVTLDAGGPYASYRWSTGENTRSIIVTRAGTYTVTVTNAAGCTGIASFTVAVGGGGATPYIAGNPTLCGDSTVLMAMPRSFSYRWSTGDTTRSITVRAPGTYAVTVTDSFGCRSRAEVTVKTGLRLVPVIEGRTAICDGDTIDLWIAVACDSCRWSTGDTARRIRIHAPGVYTVTAWRAGYCAGGADTVTVGAGRKPTPSILGPARLCAGDTGMYAVQGVAGHTVTWKQTGGAFVGPAAGPSARVRWTAPGQWSVTVVEVDDSSGCADSATFPVTVAARPQPVVTALGPLRFCDGDSVVLDAGAGYGSYRWSDSATTQRIVVRRGGTYTVTVTNAEGCSATSIGVAVAVIPAPSARIAGPSSLCRDAVARYTLDPPDSVEARWTCIGGALLGSDTALAVDIRWPASGAGIVIVRVRRNGCEARDTLAVTVGDSRILPLTATPGPSLCEGDSAAIDAGAGYVSYTWTDSSGAEIGRARAIIVRRSGEYRVTAVDSSGCRGIGTIRIAVYAAPAPQISGPAALCEGDTVTLDAGPAWRAVRWSTGDTSRAIRVARAGSFTVTVTDSNGCTGVSAPFAVVQHAAPPPPVITQRGDTLSCSPAATYQWYCDGAPIPGATARELIVTRDGRYSVRVTDGFGCASRDSIAWSAPAIIVELPVMEAAPGDRITIPIIARPVQQLAASGITGYRTAVRFHGGVLAQVDAAVPWLSDGDARIVSLDRGTPPSDNPIGTISCLVMLGAVDETPLTFDSFEFTGAPVRVTRIDGKLTVRVCREGVARLFDGSGRLALAQNAPNPFNASTRISFELIERGPTRLLVHDMLGRCVAVLLDGPMEPGRRSIDYDASALASGAYVLTLQTPSATLARIMLVKK